MITLKQQYPFINNKGNRKNNLIKFYAEDDNGDKYYIKQVETNTEFTEAIDIYPSKYTYELVNKKVETNSNKSLDK